MELNTIDPQQPIRIGDKFTKGKHLKAEVVDIIQLFSTAKNEQLDRVIYIAKSLGLASNEHEVVKFTIQRGRYEQGKIITSLK
jgi:hypothetical protein